VAADFVESARVAIGTHERGGIEDPTLDQFLKPPLGLVVEHTGATERVQVAIGVKPELGGSVETVGQLLAGIAQGLKVTNGVGMLKGCHGWCSALGPLLPLCNGTAFAASAGGVGTVGKASPDTR
jgi:hypothetical protein